MGNPVLFEPAPAEAHTQRLDVSAATQSSGSAPLEDAPLRGEPWPSALEASCLEHLRKLSAAGVALSEAPDAPVFLVHYGGDVSADGSCLFASVARAIGDDTTPAALRHRVVKRVLADAGAGLLPRDVDSRTETAYSPDLTKGWGVHWVQERRLLLRAEDAPAALAAIDDLVATGMDRPRAAEVVYGERATPVNDVRSWAHYMACDGGGGSEYRIVTLRYCEEGLLDVEDDLAGGTAAFGDELALLGLATELRRCIYVVQAHGTDAGLGEAEGALFFLPHAPLAHAAEAAAAAPPLFLFMRGTSWCAGGGDHFEPCIAVRAPPGTAPAFTL